MNFLQRFTKLLSKITLLLYDLPQTEDGCIIQPVFESLPGDCSHLWTAAPYKIKIAIAPPQRRHQRGPVVVRARFARNEIDGHSSVAAAVPAAKSRATQAARLPLQRDLPDEVVLSTGIDPFRDFNCQLQRGRCLKPGNARLATGARAFDKRRELTFERLFAFDLDLCPV